MKYNIDNVKKEVKKEVTTVTRNDFLSHFLEGMREARERLTRARRSRARRKKKKRGPMVDCYNHWLSITDSEVSAFKHQMGYDDTFYFNTIQAKGASKAMRGLRSMVGGGRVWQVTKDEKLIALFRTSKAECFVERC